jgi:tryptophan-rich sensory protein
MRHWKSLVVFLALVALAAFAGSQAQPDAWYASIAKPSFNPPNWIFAPVWTTLYVLMAVAAWRVWVRSGLSAAVVLWGVQLVLNAIWSPLFFELHRIDLALADIVALLVLLIATVVAFFRIDRVAGWLMVPYLAWVAFATVLTGAIFRLNVG